MEMFIVPIKPMEKIEFSPVVSNEPEETSNSFGNMLSEAIKEFETVTKTAEADSFSLALGDANDLAQIQINAMKAEAMLQTAVQLTSRTVNAYKEIMQMQV